MDFANMKDVPKTWCAKCVLEVMNKLREIKERKAEEKTEEKKKVVKKKQSADEVEVIHSTGVAPKVDWLTPLLNKDRTFPPALPDGQTGKGEMQQNPEHVVPMVGKGLARTDRLAGLRVWMDAVCVPNWNIGQRC